MKGTVKWFSKIKGYGFIREDGTDKEIFFHITGVDNTYEPFEGAPVQFEVGQGRKGEKAVNVRDGRDG